MVEFGERGGGLFGGLVDMNCAVDMAMVSGDMMRDSLSTVACYPGHEFVDSLKLPLLLVLLYLAILQLSLPYGFMIVIHWEFLRSS